MQMSTEVLVAEERMSLPRLARMRAWLFRFVKGVGLTWLCALLLAFQANQHDSPAPVQHPLQRVLLAGAIDVDMTSITVVSRLVRHPSYELGAWKHMIKGVTHALSGVADAPARWELTAEIHDGYRAVRYEGRGAKGTHWVVAAYQLGGDDTVYVSLRSERRAFPEDLRLEVYELRQWLHTGVDNPLEAVDTRIVVSGRAESTRYLTPVHLAENLLDAVGPATGMRVRENGPAVWVSARSPFLVAPDGADSNIEIAIVPEGDRNRVTLGTPYLGTVETTLSSGHSFAYTSSASGQTMAREVR